MPLNHQVRGFVKMVLNHLWKQYNYFIKVLAEAYQMVVTSVALIPQNIEKQ